MTNAPRDWWDNPELPGECSERDFWQQHLERQERQQQKLQPPQQWPTQQQPHRPVVSVRSLSERARALRATFPLGTRKPGGRDRAGQRSAGRRIPKPFVPVDPYAVETIFGRRWDAKGRQPSVWRVRGLALVAVAMSVARGTTILRLCSMQPAEVLGLAMPKPAWRWVLKWLGMRRACETAASDQEPWLAIGHSRGTWKQMSWLATRTLDRAGLPGWRLCQLLRARSHPGSGWDLGQRLAKFREVTRLLRRDSGLRQLGASRWAS